MKMVLREQKLCKYLVQILSAVALDHKYSTCERGLGTTFGLILAEYEMAQYVVYQKVKWKGLIVYNVASPLNIWTKFSVWLPRILYYGFPGPSMVDPPQEKIE